LRERGIQKKWYLNPTNRSQRPLTLTAKPNRMREIEQIPVLKDSIPAIIEICERHHVLKLYVFGSVITAKFDPDRSDIDLIVELAPMPSEEKGEHLLDLWDELEELFQRKVDLLTDQPIKNTFLKKNIEKTKLLIYDREREEILV